MVVWLRCCYASEGVRLKSRLRSVLGDRDYMRPQQKFGGRRLIPREMSAVHLLLAINIGVFVCDAILRSPKANSTSFLMQYMALSLDGLRHGYIWQLLTFQFMHAGILHITLNLLTLYFIGPALESWIGKKEFMRLYLISGACGGLLQMFCSWVAPGHFGEGAVVGASAGVFGVVGAYAALHPYQRLTMLVFFVLPISMKAKTLIYIAGALALYGIIFSGDNIAHAAHLGGMISGILYLRSHRSPIMKLPSSYVHLLGGKHFKIFGGKEIQKEKDTKTSTERSYTCSPRFEPRKQDVKIIDVVEDENFIEKKVDPILDKISKEGISSLTDEEREILERACKRMKRD